MSLIISVRDSKAHFNFFFDEITELLLGRPDASTGSEPDINLETYGAADKGVSRRHAVIVRRDTALNVIDLDTPNGTFLNGQRLIANQPRILRDGDELRLGHMILRVSFARL
jgi:pSer/pThr/pTyr-binding forkhead associated (FHA) protein